MNYWHVLAEARDALEEGRFRDAEEAHDRAHAAREADRRRVFVSEQLPDGLRRAWSRLRGRAGDDEPGRWNRAVGAFRTDFRARAEASLKQASRQLELGTNEDPETSFELLAAALYLSVASLLCDRRLRAAPLLLSLFELLPLTGRLVDRDLVTPELVLDPDQRLALAVLARDHLDRLPEAERHPWAATVLELLDAGRAERSPTQETECRWLAAGVADLHGDDVGEVLQRWAEVDDPAASEARRHWSRLRRLEILGGCDRHQLPVPRPEEARRLAAELPDEGEEEVPRRRRAALAVIAHRRPREQLQRGWISASLGEDGAVRAVYWWGAEPRDLATWHPGGEEEALRSFLAAAGGRVVWHVAPPAAESLPGWPQEARGRAIGPYLEAVLEAILPAQGWNEDLARRLALARSGRWRERWRSDLGHALLRPPGQDGRFGPEQAALEAALQTGLLWLAVLGRMDEADPALRAGLGELGRRGHAAAAFLHECVVLGAPDKATVDQTFEPWTLPLLWTRPDPLTPAQGADADDVPREDLAGQDVAVVSTGRPANVMAAWGSGSRRWRVVLDRMDRLGHLRRCAREAYGPVTVVPPRGEVHHLGAALGLLEDLASADVAPGDELLAVCHWIRLVETHNGDLLDHEVWRPRPAGTCPLYDRYAGLLAGLPRQPVPAAGDPEDGGWGDQYAQRVRRSGLVAGLVEDLPDRAGPLDAVWGVFDGSEASWVFLDSTAVHWRLESRTPGSARRLHALLAPRGQRHLSLMGGVGLFPGALAGWLDEALAAYGRPYHLSLEDAAPPRLGLAARGPLDHACLDPVAARAAPLHQLREAGPDTTVLLPRREEAAGFWKAAAAGAFGPVRWRAATHVDEVVTARLVVPLLGSLDLLLAMDRPEGDDPAAWQRADAARREHRREAMGLAALECGALLATPAAAVELLDVRWWRLLAAPGMAPEEAARWAGVPRAELVDLETGRPPAELVDWVRERVPAAGILDDWPGPPLADGPPLEASGVRLHPAPARLLWRDLAADLLRAWETGKEAPTLLVVADRPPPGAATLSAHLAAAGKSVPADDAEGPLAPLVWLRPDDLLALLAGSRRPPVFDRVLVMDLDGLLPARRAVGGARLLGWFARGGARRLDLVGSPLTGPWTRYLVSVLDAEAPRAGDEPGGWSGLRRAAGVQLERRCPVCDHRGPGAVDGLVCTGCGADLILAGAAPVDTTLSRERARQLLGQADLGREEPLEIWDDAARLESLRQEIRESQGGEVEPGGEAWLLPDGRRWRLRPLVTTAQAEGRALLLSVPCDPAELRPRAPAAGRAELNLVYDRLDLGGGEGPSAAATDRLLSLLRDARWLEGERSAGPSTPPLRPLVPVWRLAWLAGVENDEVARQLALLRWAGVLAGDLPGGSPVVDAAAPALRLQVHVAVRDMELILAGLAAELERKLDPLLAGGVEGAWHEATAPRPTTTDGDQAGAPSRLDRVLALASSWPSSTEDRLGYRAPGGAWFSRRRLVTCFGDRDRLAGDLLHDLDSFAQWIRDRLEGRSRVDTGFVVPLDEAPGDPALERRLLLGQELGFWTRGAPGGAAYLPLAELHRLLGTAVLEIGSPAVLLLQGLAADRDRWRRRLTAAPPGGAVPAADRKDEANHEEDPGRRWWRRERRDPVAEESRAVADRLRESGPGRLVLVGCFGTGRTGALVAGLAGSAEGRAVPVWCPDLATAVRVHLAARAVDPAWRPRVRIWRPDDPLPQAGAHAPGERVLLAVTELQRFPREVAYRLQESAREGCLVLTVDPAEVHGASEDLFLTTPRRDELRELRTPVLQAQQPWRVSHPLHPAGLLEARGQRRDRGTVMSRRAGTLDECASAVAASLGSGRLGSLVSLTTPLAEDARLLGRALADRGWAAVARDELDAWLLPGVMELAAALADAHRRRHGAWPGAEQEPVPDRAGSLLGELLPDGEAEDWTAWLRSLPEAVLDDAAAFLARLRRSPWHRVCCAEPAARERAAALVDGAAGASPGQVIEPAVWQAWRRTLATVLERPDLDAGPPAVVLATAADPGPGPAESTVYVCFGPEPVAVHRQVISRATDRLLVLYQEHSPLPGEAEAPGG